MTTLPDVGEVVVLTDIDREPRLLVCSEQSVIVRNMTQWVSQRSSTTISIQTITVTLEEKVSSFAP
jgi:hypothetical protein